MAGLRLADAFSLERLLHLCSIMYNYGCYLSYYYATDLSPKVLQQQYVDEVGK